MNMNFIVHVHLGLLYHALQYSITGNPGLLVRRYAVASSVESFFFFFFFAQIRRDISHEKYLESWVTPRES